MKRILILMLSLICMFAISACGNKNFDKAKKETIKYTQKHFEKIKEVAEEVMSKESAYNVSCGKFENVMYDKLDDYEFIQFEYDAQGMLGGQYWGIYYSSDNKPYFEGGEDVEVTEYENGWVYFDQQGNNSYYTERIENGWFFWYTDYDMNEFPEKK